MQTYYRIATDTHAGFEVQAWRWWWPVWRQCAGPKYLINTHPSVEDAERFAAAHAAGFPKVGLPKVVKYLGGRD